MPEISQSPKCFKDQLKGTMFLLKNSFIIIGKDKDMKTPLIKMSIFSIFLRFIVLGSISTFFFFRVYIPIGVLGLLFALFILWPIKFFYYTYERARLSWITYNTICGKDISYKDAKKHIKEQKGTLRYIGLVSMIMALMKNKEKKDGIMGMLISFLLSALEEVWDLLENFMIPGVVIEGKHLKKIITKLKALKENIPATLAGVFMDNFVGEAMGKLLTGLGLLLTLGALGISYLIGIATDVTVVKIFGVGFSWVPVIFVFILISLLNGIMTQLIQGLQSIYFTVFYTTLSSPGNIRQDMKEELTSYLKLGEKDTQKSNCNDTKI